MPQNFTKILFNWLAILTGIIILTSLVMYQLANYRGRESPFILIFIVLSFYITAHSLTLGLGLQDLVRKNKYKVPLKAIFGFAALYVFIPFVIMKVIMLAKIIFVDTAPLRMNQIISAMTSDILTPFIILFISLTFSGRWLVFSKANKDGWMAIVPILNFVEMTDIAKKPMDWIFLIFIPFVNIVVYILLLNALAEVFNKSKRFAAGLFFLPFIFFPILGFGDAKYKYAEHGDFTEYKKEKDGLKIEDHLVE